MSFQHNSVQMPHFVQGKKSLWRGPHETLVLLKHDGEEIFVIINFPSQSE